MRRLLVLALLLPLLMGNGRAMEIDCESIVGDLRRELPQEVQDTLDEDRNVSEQLKHLIADALEKSIKPAKDAIGSMVKLLMIALLCSILISGDQPRLRSAAILAGTLAVLLACAGDLHGMIGAGSALVEDISVFLKSLLPVMASAAAGGGNPGKASVLYSVTVLFSNLFIWFCRMVLVPLIYGGLALSAVDTVVQNGRLEGLRSLIQWFVKFGLRTIMYCFTGFLTFTGVLSGSADALALKAAKVTLSGMVPVVGGILSDAADTVLAGASLVKSAVGTFGMLAVLAMFAAPFLKAGIQYLLFRFTAAACGVLGGGLQDLLKAIADSAGAVLAMTGSCMLMAFLSCLCFMRTVSL